MSTPSRFYVKGPSELSTLLHETARDFADQTNGPLRMGLPGLDDVLVTMRPGRVTGVIAVYSNGKSTFMKHAARQACQQLIAEGRADKEMILYVTLEESDAAVTADITGSPVPMDQMFSGNFSMEAVQRHSLSVIEWPLYVAGYGVSTVRAVSGVKPPKLTIEQILSEVQQIEADEGKRCAGIFLDYIQLAATLGRGGDDQAKVALVDNAFVAARELAVQSGAHVVVACQASRGVEHRDIPVPRLADIQWTSLGQQILDSAITLWMPHRYPHSVHKGRVELGGEVWPVIPGLLVVGLVKQRDGIGYGQWVYHCNMQTKSIGLPPVSSQKMEELL